MGKQAVGNGGWDRMPIPDYIVNRTKLLGQSWSNSLEIGRSTAVNFNRGDALGQPTEEFSREGREEHVGGI